MTTNFSELSGLAEGRLDLSRRQRVALRHPCFRAEQTVHSRYFEISQFAPMSSLLTFNVGMEWAAFFGGAPLWHVSIAVRSPLTQSPKPVLRWSPEEKKAAEDYAARVLQGAGIDGREVTEWLGSSMHIRRETTAAERDAFFRSPAGRSVARKHEMGG